MVLKYLSPGWPRSGPSSLRSQCPVLMHPSSAGLPFLISQWQFDLSRRLIWRIIMMVSSSPVGFLTVGGDQEESFVQKDFF